MAGLTDKMSYRLDVQWSPKRNWEEGRYNEKTKKSQNLLLHIHIDTYTVYLHLSLL